MKRSRFSEAQIIGILKEHETGMCAPDLCRKHGVSDATSYNWRRKYGGMEVADSKRLKTMETENAKLKEMLVEQMMDVAKLKEMLKKASVARFEEEGWGLGHEDQGLQSTPPVCAGLNRSACVSATIEASD